MYKNHRLKRIIIIIYVHLRQPNIGQLFVIHLGLQQLIFHKAVIQTIQVIYSNKMEKQFSY